MERRIKFIYGLTICAIATFSIVQGYWLYSRYRLSLEEYKSELYSTIIACAEEEMAIRNTLPHPPRFYGNRLRKTSEIKGDNVVETWRYEVFALDTLQYVPKGTDAHTYLLDYIASLHDSILRNCPKAWNTLCLLVTAKATKTWEQASWLKPSIASPLTISIHSKRKGSTAS